MTEKYPASDYPAPKIKGYPGQPVTPNTAYIGCRVRHSDDWDGDLLGIETDFETAVVTLGDGDIWGSCPLSDLEIAPDNQPSPIGRDQCGVRRTNGVIERVAMFDGADALLVYWGPAGGWRGHQWEPISALGDRYAKVGTLAECEAWKMEQEQEKPKLRYAAESATADPCSSLICVLDRVAGCFLTASQVESYLNAADRKTEGGE
jgi:hypothetical protein